jgi:hypothetical protein
MLSILRALGGNRSKTAIEKRVRQLNLHLSRDVDSGSDSDEGQSKRKAAGAVSGSDEDEISFGSSSSSDASADEDSTTGDGASDDGDENKGAEKRSKKQKAPTSQERKSRKDALVASTSAAPSGSSKTAKKSRYDLSNFAVASTGTEAGSGTAVKDRESDSDGELDLIDDVEETPAGSADSTAPGVDMADTNASSPPPRFIQNKARKTASDSSPGNQGGKSKAGGSDLSWLDDAAANSDDDKWSGIRTYKPRANIDTTAAAPIVTSSPTAAPTGKLHKKKRVASDDDESDDGLWGSN